MRFNALFLKSSDTSATCSRHEMSTQSRAETRSVQPTSLLGYGPDMLPPAEKTHIRLTGFAANVAHAKHTQIHLSEDLRFLSSSGSTVIGDSRGIQVPAPRSRTSPSQVVRKIEIAKLSGAFNTNRLKHDSGEQDQNQPREPKYTFT